ncbi:type II restriction endonuclease [uncultured Gardnerella sp.]|uniref:type II restriction endonuclease n=1 Tax=uncultured Gardnerella sp. TaxID=293424 RepID=UPI0025DC127B|nr:type II restriction endonuclease [uncultured Gardnerella sp.]
MERNFDDWFSTFRENIATYDFYVDFKKVYSNVDSIKIELNILNSLVGSRNIDEDFDDLLTKYPEVIKCIPILLAVRSYEIYCQDNIGNNTFYFNPQKFNFLSKLEREKYKYFMRKTGLFELLQHHIVMNLVDYVTGVETGLDSNARKNRGGHIMEDLVEKFIQSAGFIKGKNYFKEMYIHEIFERWKIDLSSISNQGKMEKRFDFVVKTDGMVYGIETNFYSSGGSKLNETSRSYKTIALESKDVKGFTFVWFTDGKGWERARNNLEETFDVMHNLYNIHDIEHGVMKEIFK